MEIKKIVTVIKKNIGTLQLLLTNLFIKYTYCFNLKDFNLHQVNNMFMILAIYIKIAH